MNRYEKWLAEHPGAKQVVLKETDAPLRGLECGNTEALASDIIFVGGAASGSFSLDFAEATRNVGASLICMPSGIDQLIPQYPRIPLQSRVGRTARNVLRETVEEGIRIRQQRLAADRANREVTVAQIWLEGEEDLDE